MTIASEITRINNNIAAAYTAASGKGATLPATENSANLATCIGSISGGGGLPYGLTIAEIPYGDYSLLVDPSAPQGLIEGVFANKKLLLVLNTDTVYALILIDENDSPDGYIAVNNGQYDTNNSFIINAVYGALNWSVDITPATS